MNLVPTPVGTAIGKFGVRGFLISKVAGLRFNELGTSCAVLFCFPPLVIFE